MIDIKTLRQNPDFAQAQLRKRDPSADVHMIVQVDDERKKLVRKIDGLRQEKRRLSEAFRPASANSDERSNISRELTRIGGELKHSEERLSDLEMTLRESLLSIPNIPDEIVPAGGKEANIVLRSWGKKPSAGSAAKDHVELSTLHNLVDYERGVKLSGNGSWVYKGAGARLEWALLNFFIDFHQNNGYEFILPPHILKYENGTAAGQFPKFKDEVYFLADDPHRQRFLLPTAETAIINYHRGEILPESELPVKYYSYTPCYRVESGSYRKSERGTLRGHQFNKVEMFQFTKPEDSDTALKELVVSAENLLQQLELHYRVSRLAAGDCSFAMAQTIDLEVWIPSIGEYKEVSSASTARDYQARRANIRYKSEGKGKNDFLHTLNASGLATSRLVPALLEQHQHADGSVNIPKALRRYLGMDRLG